MHTHWDHYSEALAFGWTLLPQGRHEGMRWTSTCPSIAESIYTCRHDSVGFGSARLGCLRQQVQEKNVSLPKWQEKSLRPKQGGD